jgi:hypothetical protein
MVAVSVAVRGSLIDRLLKNLNDKSVSDFDTRCFWISSFQFYEKKQRTCHRAQARGKPRESHANIPHYSQARQRPVVKFTIL